MLVSRFASKPLRPLR